MPDEYDTQRDNELDFPPDDEPDPRADPDYWNGLWEPSDD